MTDNRDIPAGGPDPDGAQGEGQWPDDIDRAILGQLRDTYVLTDPRRRSSTNVFALPSHSKTSTWKWLASRRICSSALAREVRIGPGRSPLTATVSQ